MKRHLCRKHFLDRRILVAALLSVCLALSTIGTTPIITAHAQVAGPEPPIIGEPSTGEVHFLNTTNFLVSGISEANTTVHLFAEDIGVAFPGIHNLGTTIVNNTDGSWAISVELSSDGSYRIYAIAVDLDGTKSAASRFVIVIIDTDIPEPPTIFTSYLVDKELVEYNGSLIAELRFDVAGESTDGIIELFDNGEKIATLNPLAVPCDEVEPTGCSDLGFQDWEIAENTTFSSGLHNLVAFAIDPANNVSPPSNVFSFTLDKIGPAGYVVIDSNASRITDPDVTLTVSCDDRPGFGCAAISVEWVNSQLDTSDGIDKREVTVAVESGNSITVNATETGEHSGIFSFSFSNDDDVGDFLDFSDGDIVTVTGVIFSSELGTKSVEASFEDWLEQESTARDTTELVEEDRGRADGPPKDREPPKITAPPDVVVEATGESTEVLLGSPEVSDNKDPVPNVTNDAPQNNLFPYGATLVTWTATDRYGNSATDTQLVTVQDIFIDGISDSNPAWDDSVTVTGIVVGTNDTDSNNYSISINWGDEETSTEIPMVSSSSWGPISHSYSSDAAAFSPLNITATLISVEDDAIRATSNPVEVLLNKHETAINLDVSLDTTGSEEASKVIVRGQLVDKLTGEGISARNISIKTDNSDRSVSTASDGSFTFEAETRSLAGKSIVAAFGEDELYLSSSNSKDIPKPSDLIITLKTDKNSYTDKEQVAVSGWVSQKLEPDQEVRLLITNPEGHAYLSESIQLQDDLSFDLAFQIQGDLAINGKYLVEAQYGSAEKQISFDYTALTSNQPPVAEADAELASGNAAPPGSTINLDGTKSFDPDGDNLTYRWIQVGGPPVTLVGENTATPSFLVPERQDGDSEDYVFQLIVTDGSLESPAVTVRVPVAKPLISPIVFAGIGGGSAAAVGGGLLLYKYLRRPIPKIPILKWHVYAPANIQCNGTAYIDVIVTNFGQADAKYVKVSTESPTLECSPPSLVQTIMPWETRKFTCWVKHSSSTDASGQRHTVDISLQSKWILREEFLALLMSSEVKWVRKKEKSITLTVGNLSAGLVTLGRTTNEEIAGRTGMIQDWLKRTGLSQSGKSSQRDTMIVIPPANNEINEEQRQMLSNLVRSGTGLVIMGPLIDAQAKRNQAGRTCKLAPILGFETDNITTSSIDQVFALRIADDAHPITRSINVGETFRPGEMKGLVILSELGSGVALAEQLIKTTNMSPDSTRGIETKATPAVIVNSIATAKGSVFDEGRIVYFNFETNSISGIISQILEKSILWTSHSIAENETEDTEK